MTALGAGLVPAGAGAAAAARSHRTTQRLPAISNLGPTPSERPTIPIDAIPLQVAEYVWCGPQSAWVPQSRREVEQRWMPVGPDGVREWVILG